MGFGYEIWVKSRKISDNSVCSLADFENLGHWVDRKERLKKLKSIKLAIYTNLPCFSEINFG